LMFSGKDGVPDDCIDAFGVGFRELNRIMAAQPTKPPEGRPKGWLREDIAKRKAIVDASTWRPGQTPNTQPRTMWTRR